MSLPQEQTDARSSQGEAADGAAPAYRVILQLPLRVRRLSRSARRSSRVDRCGPHVGPRVDRPRLGSLAARSAALLPLLLPPLRPRPLWPLAEPPSSRQSASRSFGARPCDRARPACAAGDGAWHGRVVERGMCDCRARGARLSGETLDVGHLGSVWSPGCGLRAHMTA